MCAGWPAAGYAQRFAGAALAAEAQLGRARAGGGADGARHARRAGHRGRDARPAARDEPRGREHVRGHTRRARARTRTRHHRHTGLLLISFI